MQARIALKIGIVLLISLLLLTIPLEMIRGLIGERQHLRDGVVQEIARESVDAQQLRGPVIVVPYKRRTLEVTTEEKNGQMVSTKRERVREGRLAFLPDRLSIGGELMPEERHRGIYKAILYNSRLDVAGRFELPANFGITEAFDEYEFGSAELVFGIADTRGVGGGLKLDWQGSDIEFVPGANAPGFPSGVTAPLGRLATAGGGFDFRFMVTLKGLARIDFIPTGKDSTIALRSPWPSPSFYGRYLPKSAVGDDGFTAEWRTSFLSTNLRQIYERCLAASACGELTTVAHGVALFQPADIYQQLERSAKYGFLFVGLTFFTFFLYEVLKRLAIHPVQYGLVGVALATFYLLLTSLSEQVPFAIAYAISAGACVALIGFYVSYVLQSVLRAAGFTAMLAALYGMLYVLLRAEEQSLLMGSVGLFFILAIVMIGTRKVNWYTVEAAVVPRKAPS